MIARTRRKISAAAASRLNLAVEQEKLVIERHKLRWQVVGTLVQAVSAFVIAGSLCFAIYTYRDVATKDFRRTFVESELRTAERLVEVSARIAAAASADDEAKAISEFWPLRIEVQLFANRPLSMAVQRMAEYLMTCYNKTGHGPGLHWPPDLIRPPPPDKNYCNSPTLNSIAMDIARESRNWFVEASETPLENLDAGQIFRQWSRHSKDIN